MADPPSRLAVALADRYQLERELGQGGMATVSALEGKCLIYAVPVSGAAREVAHSEGPTYQNFRFTFSVRRDSLYFVLADRKSDLWMAEMLPQ